MEANIVCLPGDGIGPEVIAAALAVLQAAAVKFNHHFNFTEHLIGGCAIDRSGTALTPETLAACQSADAVLLGAVGGVLIGDYFIIRRTRLDLPGLYDKNGPYWYAGGFNPLALVALVLGIAPCIPGFLATVSTRMAQSIPPMWTEIYHYAWFISFGISLLVYVVLMVLRRAKIV